MGSLLKSRNYRGYSSTDEEDIIHEVEPWEIPNRTKKWLITLGTLVAVCLLYMFCFLLPKTFIPETKELVGIHKAEPLDVILTPVLLEKANLWGLTTLEYDDFSDDDDEEDEHDLRVSSDEEVNIESNSMKKLKERLILVGDAHGQYRELKKLLRKVKYKKERDQLLVLGDFITKGPHSFKVLDFLIDNDIACIMGNHEYYVLQNYATYHGLPQPFFVNGTAPSFRTTGKFNSDPEFLLAKKLKPKHVEYINNCPVMKELGQVPLHSKKNKGKYGHTEGVAVHAGLRMEFLKDLNAQDPEDCLEMRSYIGPYYNETTDDPSDKGAVSWSKIWNQKQKAGELDRSLVVYYGHDAGRGLKLKKFTKGLDSGCTKGGKLSALVMWQEKLKGSDKVMYKETLVQQKC